LSGALGEALMKHGRIAVTLVLGVIAGVSATRLLREDGADEAADVATPSERSTATTTPQDRFDLPLERPVGVTERAQVYDFASRANLETLESAIDEALGSPPSSQRQFVLAAFADRAAEIDPEGALDLLRSMDLDSRTARALGLVVLDALPADSDSIASVIAALPQMDAQRFEIEALTQISAVAPERALELALAINEEAQRVTATAEVARVWAEQDPHAALARAESIEDDDLRMEFTVAALRELAHTDIGAGLAYVEDRHADGTQERARLVRIVVEETVRTDPARALGLVRQIGGQAALQLQYQAVERLARQDPHAAFAYTESVAPGMPRRNLRDIVARTFGQRDPDAALAWVESFNPPAADLRKSVLDGVARVDPIRALELSIASSAPRTRYPGGGFENFGLINSAFTNVATHNVPRTAIAERVLAIEDASMREEWAQTVAGVWARVDTRAAVDWLVANHSRVGKAAYSSAAQAVGQSDPTAGLRYGNQLPDEVRDSWVDGVAQAAAMNDPSGAAEWLAQFRGEPVYERAASAVVRASGFRGDPAQVTPLFATLPEAEQVRSAAALGEAWARRDVDAGTRWALSLPAGAVRDAALRGVVGASDGMPDPSTLALFSTREAREAAVVNVVRRIAARDVPQARRLLAEHVSDPALRARVEYDLQQIRR
jgi:hypothetical protein